MAMDQFVNQAAKNRYMFGGQATIPVVFRSAMFYGGNTRRHHSDRPYPMFMNVPGLKIIVPARPRREGPARKAVDPGRQPGPIFEDATLWGRRGRGPAPEAEDHLVPLGVARSPAPAPT